MGEKPGELELGSRKLVVSYLKNNEIGKMGLEKMGREDILPIREPVLFKVASLL